MILVTGGTGFLGSHLLFHLIHDGKKVKAIKRAGASIQLTEKIFSYYSDSPKQLVEKTEWIEGDILDYGSLADALEGVEIIYHCGAMVSFHGEDKKQLIKTNIEGTANIVNAAIEKKVKKLCYVSSIGALGRDSVTDRLIEDIPSKPSERSSVYSKTKYEAEREVWRGMAEGLDAIIVNPSIIVGPGDWTKGSSQMFQTMWDGLKFYTSGMNGFIDVNDVARAMITLTEGNFKNERYILNAENITYRQFFDWMADAMKIPRPKYKAGPILSKVGWIALKVKSLLNGEKHTITRETARTANKTYKYSSEKFINATGINFIPVKESVENTSRKFLDEQK